jgi:uncharacterized protein YfbU (UPF0304 family)
MALKLTKTERWILSNHYRILEVLYPKEAQDLARSRNAIEKGYEGEYDSISSRIYEGSEALSLEECKEVWRILAMYSSLSVSYKALPDKTGIKANSIEFDGFDGNNETSQMTYTRYIYEGGSYTNLSPGRDNFNNHGSTTLDIYRRMLSAWEATDKSNHLSRDDIIRVLDERIDPSNR